MKKNLIILTGILLLIAAYTYYADRYAVPAAEYPQSVAKASLEKADDFLFQDIDGKNHSLKEFGDKAIIVNFWASWCAPCVIEFPQMIKLAAREKNTVFLFLTWDENKDDVTRFLKKYGQGLPLENVVIGYDTDRKIANGIFDTKQLPETHFINTSGELADKVIGADVDWTGPAIKAKMEHLKNQ